MDKGVRNIGEMGCDTTKPFVFISYSHEKRDKEIVGSLFSRLHGDFNLWIDEANIEKSSATWQKYAKEALSLRMCSGVLFFRSESAVVSQPIFEELDYANDARLKTVVVDIWESVETAGELLKSFRLGAREAEDGSKAHREFIKNEESLAKLCKIIDPDCNAIRFNKFGQERAYLEIVVQLEKMGVGRKTCREQGNRHVTQIYSPEKQENRLTIPVIPEPEDVKAGSDIVIKNKILTATEPKYKILTLNKGGADIPKDSELALCIKTKDISSKMYKVKSHSTATGRVDRLSEVYSDYGTLLKEGAAICLEYDSDKKIITITDIS